MAQASHAALISRIPYDGVKRPPEPTLAELAELDATIAERCRRLDAAAIRPHTDFHWWPRPKKPN